MATMTISLPAPMKDWVEAQGGAVQQLERLCR
ncbi:MAG: hypothetical protein JWN21_2129 [Sphingomonas bacterium]|nr:hypothetical protein [Sphingomonas bacterium]